MEGLRGQRSQSLVLTHAHQALRTAVSTRMLAERVTEPQGTVGMSLAWVAGDEVHLLLRNSMHGQREGKVLHSNQSKLLAY